MLQKKDNLTSTLCIKEYDLAKTYISSGLFFLGYGLLFFGLKKTAHLYHFPDASVAKLTYKITSSVCILLIVISALLHLRGRIDSEGWKKATRYAMVFFTIDSLLIALTMTDVKKIIPLIIHHYIVIFVFAFQFESQTKLVARAILCEIPSLLSNVTWFLVKINSHNTKFFYALVILLILFWIVLRIANFMYLQFQLYKKGYPLHHQLISLFFLLFDVFNFLSFILNPSMQGTSNIKALLKNLSLV